MFGGCAQYDPVKPAEALFKLAGTTVLTFSEYNYIDDDVLNITLLVQVHVLYTGVLFYCNCLLQKAIISLLVYDLGVLCCRLCSKCHQNGVGFG